MRTFLKNAIVSILELEARAALRRYRPFIVAVTGSVGKTGAKDAIYHALAAGNGVRKSEKSFNSEIGLPLTVLGLPNAWNDPVAWLRNIWNGALLSLVPGRFPDTLVLEVGADHPGDIGRAMQWISPDISVVTRLPDRPVHVEYFSSPEEVRKEKAKLVRGLKPDGTFVANADDPAVLALAGLTKAKMITYGFAPHADVRGSDMDILYDDADRPLGMTFTATYGKERATVRLSSVLGVQPVAAVLAAFAVGVTRGERLEPMAAKFADFRSAPGRMRIVPGANGSTLIDDSYNSSPIALEAALSVLRGMKAKRRIALLGDMLELGDYSAEEHEKAGNIAAGSAEILLTVGARAEGMAKAAIASGMTPERVRSFENSEEAGAWLKPKLEAGDVVLVKGSQGSGANMIRMERAIREIMAEPARAPEFLVRQEAEWQKQYVVDTKKDGA